MCLLNGVSGNRRGEVFVVSRLASSRANTGLKVFHETDDCPLKCDI